MALQPIGEHLLKRYLPQISRKPLRGFLLDLGLLISRRDVITELHYCIGNLRFIN